MQQPTDNKRLITVIVSLRSDAEKSWGVLINHSDDLHYFADLAWFPKSLCTLVKSECGYHYFLTAPKWLLDKNKVKYVEEKDSSWKLALLDQIQEATDRRCIGKNTKKLALSLLENFDTKFQLIFKGNRMEYSGIIFLENLDTKTSYFILKNYGAFIYRSFRDNKRL